MKQMNLIISSMINKKLYNWSMKKKETSQVMVKFKFVKKRGVKLERYKNRYKFK